MKKLLTGISLSLLLIAGMALAIDYNEDGKADIAVFRDASGRWAVRGVTRIYFGRRDDHPVPGNYNGPPAGGVAIFRPQSGLWAMRGITRFYFGRNGDFPIVGDYNGNGIDETGIYRPDSGLWAIRNLTRIYFGTGSPSPITGNYTGDAPVTGDFDGDGSNDLGIFRKATGLWALRGITRIYYGSGEDRPIPGDYQGDGTFNVAVFRENNGLWAVRSVTRAYFGGAGDLPQPADYSGNGTDMLTLFRSSAGRWSLRQTTTFYYGSSGDFPVTANIYQDFYLDFGWMGWTQAFDAAHQKFSREYAFTEWKGIDWNALSAIFRPRISAAESFNNQTDYYLALREYVHSVHDGHVSLAFAYDFTRLFDQGVKEEIIGGGYGLGLIGLDNGSVVANLVLKNGPAARAGLQFGAEILQWNGMGIETALAQLFPFWCPFSSATNEIRLLQQYRSLVRAPVGTQANVVFQNRGDSEPTSVEITAEGDEFKTWNFTKLFNLEFYEVPVEYEVLPSGYGYLKVTVEPDAAAFFAQSFEAAVQMFVDQSVPGVIFDLRRNLGGADDLAAWMSGFFTSQTDFYEYASFYNKASGEFSILTDLTLWVEPKTPRYDGPVVVMVSPGCISSGEGPAMSIQKLPQGRVISFYGSNGSFGMSGGKIVMPGGFQLGYPYGRSLDLNQRIQLDANGNGRGGVIPDIYVPVNDAMLDAGFFEDTDFLATDLRKEELDYVIQIFPQLREEMEKEDFLGSDLPK